MALISLEVNSGTGKNNKPWYMATTIAGKYRSEPMFISQLEYDYLADLTDVKDNSLSLDDK